MSCSQYSSEEECIGNDNCEFKDGACHEKIVEEMTMMNDGKHMNNILVFGVLIVLFLFVYMYGFHGLLKFEKNINYLLTILFSGVVILVSLGFIMSLISYVSDGTLTDTEKTNARTGLITTIMIVVVFSMLAFIRYNYALLYNSLNKTLK